ncbi:MAG: hypothetical protein HZA19_07045 [Nitrospirae bacterium]|nr:hypothetical protein [Nitrospirota bacterium]
MAVNANGDIYVVWEDASTMDRDISFAKSTNQGVSFSVRVVVNDNPGPGDLRDQIQPTIAVAPDDTLYVAWEENENSNLTDSDIYVTASIDGGDSFEARFQVAGNVVPSEMRSPALVVDSAGIPTLIWEDHTNWYSVLHLSKISLAGDNLQATEPASLPTTGLPTTSTQVHPAVSIDGSNRIYVVWESAVLQGNPQNQGTTPVRYDIYLTIRADGVTFSDPVKVNQTNATGFFGGWAYPDITADAVGNIYIVWEDYRNGFLTPDIYFTKSSEGGNPDSYETARKVNDDAGLRHEKPSVGISDSGKALVTWTDFRNNASLSCNPCNNDLYFSREP